MPDDPLADRDHLTPEEFRETAVRRLMARGWGRDEAEQQLLREEQLEEE